MDDQRIAAIADTLPRGLRDVFASVWALEGKGAVNMAGICRHADMAKSVVCRHLKKLEDLGVIVRERQADGHRFFVADASDVDLGLVSRMLRAQATRGALARRGVVIGDDGLTQGQRDLMVRLQALCPPEGKSLASLARAMDMPIDKVSSFCVSLCAKGLIRLWTVQQDHGLRPVRMLQLTGGMAGDVPAAVTMAAAAEVPEHISAADRAARRLYGEMRYEDLPPAQRVADRINTPVPYRALRHSPTQWSGA